MKTTDFTIHLYTYLTKYLLEQKNASPNTVKSYIDSFKLLLIFAKEHEQISVELLSLSMIDKKFVLNFLKWLEIARKNVTSTINQRLVAIHDFFRYLQIEVPSKAFYAQDILSIPYRRKQKALINHLTSDELKVLFAQPNINAKKGRRDLAILTILYDTGARVGELINLKVCDVQHGTPTVITLTEESGKKRYVPLMTNTASILMHYMAENQFLGDKSKYEHPLFFNQRKAKMTRAGIAYILDRYAEMARTYYPALPNNTTPHLLRSTKTMHLLQAGIDLSCIRDLLGHINISTTEIYARAYRKLNQQELKISCTDSSRLEVSQWDTDKDLFDWLNNFCL